MSKVQVHLAFGDLTLAVCGIYTPGTPATMYSSGGDPGSPEESAEFEVDAIKMLDGTDIRELFEGLFQQSIVKREGVGTVTTYRPFLDIVEERVLECIGDATLF